MKPRLTALALAAAAALLLTGCAPLLHRSYSSYSPHVESVVADDSSALRAESYRGLVDALLYYVNRHITSGVIRLANYPSDVSADLENARLEVMREDPLGAFAVEELTYDFSRIVSYYEVSVSISYSHTAEEIAAIEFASGAASIRPRLRQAMAKFSSTLLLRTSYFTGDEDQVRAMAVQAYYDTPQSAFGLPEIAVTLYPDSGVQRIIALTFTWPERRTVSTARSEQLLSLARRLLADTPPEGEQYTPDELYRILLSAGAGEDGSAPSSDPYAALTGKSADQLARTLALELLFQQSGIDATLVSGVAPGGNTCWLIADCGSGYRHLLPGEETISLYTDLEMSAAGYLWNQSMYPDCVDYSAPVTTPAPEVSPAAVETGTP